jgi:thiamine-phosphate pyrophosphorylase
MSPASGRLLKVFAQSPLYAILDTALVGTRSIPSTLDDLLNAGVKVIQYRHKGTFGRENWQECCTLIQRTHAAGGLFIINDRPDMAKLCAADGVHLGQDDVPIDKARWFLGDDAIIGCSTHHIEQFEAALELPVDYIAVGPIFATASKENPDPVVGLVLLEQARRLTDKPIVAIGGITVKNAAAVLEAGANAVAVISDLMNAPEIAARAREFLAMASARPTRSGM